MLLFSSRYASKTQVGSPQEDQFYSLIAAQEKVEEERLALEKKDAADGADRRTLTDGTDAPSAGDSFAL